MSSLVSWLSKIQSGRKMSATPKSADPLLPNPVLEAILEKRVEVAPAVAKEINSWKRKAYHHYDDELKYRIGRHAAENGNESAVVKFSKELECAISESTARQFKKYYGRMKELGNPNSGTPLPRMQSGRPTLLRPSQSGRPTLLRPSQSGRPTLLRPSHKDALHKEALQDYILKLGDNGGVANRNMAISAAMDIVEHYDYGATLDLGKDWVQSLKRKLRQKLKFHQL